jgi:ABC-type glutathione transport system ATPase component
VLEHGRVVEHGRSRLLTAPASPVTQDCCATPPRRCGDRRWGMNAAALLSAGCQPSIPPARNRPVRPGAMDHALEDADVDASQAPPSASSASRAPASRLVRLLLGLDVPDRHCHDGGPLGRCGASARSLHGCAARPASCSRIRTRRWTPHEHRTDRRRAALGAGHPWRCCGVMRCSRPSGSEAAMSTATRRFSGGRRQRIALARAIVPPRPRRR